MQSSEKKTNDHLADYTDAVLHSRPDSNASQDTMGKEKELEETILFIAQTVHKDVDQGLKNRVRMKTNHAYQQQYQRPSLSFLDSMRAFLGKLQKNTVTRAAILTTAVILLTAAVILLAVPGLSQSVIGTAMGEGLMTGLLIVISCIGLITMLLLILIRK